MKLNEPEEWAASEPSGAARLPAPAATIVLLRPAVAGREVLLLRRPLQSAFAPDTWVFPGGRVDAADYEFDHANHADGPAPAQWARILSLDDPREASAYVVAAVREAWEETGILLAHGVDASRPGDAERRALLAGTRTMNELVRGAGLRLASARLRYIAHRITPDWLPRRFDTRFFLAEVAADARCALVGEELVDFRWLSPHDALHAAGTGEMTLMPPTFDTLRRLHDREL